MIPVEAAIVWIGLGLTALAVFSASYRAVPPLWLSLLTVIVGPAAFGASLITLLMKIGEGR